MRSAPQQVGVWRQVAEATAANANCWGHAHVPSTCMLPPAPTRCRCPAGMRSLGFCLMACCHVLPPLPALLLHVGHTVLTWNPAYCSTPLLAAPLSRSRQAVLAHWLELGGLPLAATQPMWIAWQLATKFRGEAACCGSAKGRASGRALACQRGAGHCSQQMPLASRFPTCRPQRAVCVYCSMAPLHCVARASHPLPSLAVDAAAACTAAAATTHRQQHAPRLVPPAAGRRCRQPQRACGAGGCLPPAPCARCSCLLPTVQRLGACQGLQTNVR